MNRVHMSVGPFRHHSARVAAARLGVTHICVTFTLCAICWVSSEWCFFRQEQLAVALLERDYGAAVFSATCSDEPIRLFGRHWIDLRGLSHGRLFVPVTHVYFNGVSVDNQAIVQLSSFRSLERLALQNCNLEVTNEFPPTCLRGLNDLDLWGTPATIDHLLAISRLRRLESLTLDGRGLTGDWMKHISTLPRLKHLLLQNGELTKGSTDFLGRMSQLTTLQLVQVKSYSDLGRAVGRLMALEHLAIDNTQFDDTSMIHLAGLNRLRVLMLSGADITDEGMLSIGHLPHLWRLSLSDTKISDAGLRHLSGLPQLTGIDIRRTHTTNSCLRALATIPSLRVALVEGTGISASSVGFQGVVRGGTWYPNETVAEESQKDN